MTKLLKGEELANYTTWRVGGLATKMVKPRNISELSAFLMQVPTDEELLWMGLGSNSLVRDGGFKGTVVLTQGCLKSLTLVGDTKVRAEAGVACAQMARFCARNNLADAEFWAGIPGTMGGALRMNAGCFNGETWDSVIELETIDRHGVLHKRKPDEFNVGYRCVEGLGEQWFVAATFQFKPGDKAKSLDTIKQLLARRAETQPTGEYNCGSVFRNPENDYAARLIESCGLKGYRLGGARVSDKHANFIINEDGAARASDIESLINFVQQTVFQETGILLQREVHIVGDSL